ncbi:RagB/SusD family nutrient uptake outer membrane protein [Pinibacter soli]|uniref:RagB/SusD family nutrient uptake outer membrane protein n=1 Tax=Pinibacter soli TaxID=3044211 RepID=A0ABT6R741_9BACT|nr:RagB/SusD family nutrient uptake outer membrane protein [Pinibacter soli]MDI3318383.1 RagB/SusD family nutrient uptake outer membrane protein [Pinibacter soli]
MKTINKIGITFLLLFILAGCKKYLDKPPLTQFTDNEYWTSESNVKIFCNGFYCLFNGFGQGATSTISSNIAPPATTAGTESNFYFPSFSDDQVNSAIDIFPTAAGSTATTWTTPYYHIRMANLLLTRIGGVSSMSDVQKNHYRGVAYFFRAMEYFDLVRHYGDVPYTNTYLDQVIDTSIIWGPRVPRNTVMDSVLNDLNNAVTLLYSKSVADVNSVTQDVAQALKSRICLYEGTYSKYQLNSATRATKYLTECKTASEAVMNGGGYQLNPDFRTVFSSMDLTGNKEVLLYRVYLDGIVTHSVVGYCNSSTQVYGLTKDAVESFLCTDGLPINLSSLYQGDASNPTTLSIAQTTLKNRDKRLTASIDSILCYTGKPNSKGFVSTTGYLITRFNNATLTPTQLLAPNNPTDAPVFWLPEVLLNEAEALAELGSFTQADADKTINLLRARAGVTSLNVTNVPNDPKRDGDVPALLWEVRRERRAELMLTSFRYWDLRRWAKLSYLDASVKPDIFKGAKVPAGTSGTQGGQDATGYILPYSTTTAAKRVVKTPQNYLDFIPTGQLQLYTNHGISFSQNPGWQ